MPGLCNPQHEATIAHFEEMTKDARRVQEELLKSILQRNALTEYLQKCGLDGHTDPQSFKKCVPLVHHADLQPYIQRIADGDKSPILTANPIETISLSSGTTDGHQKYLMLYKEQLVATLELATIAAAYRARVYPIRPGGRSLEFVFCGKLSTTKGGLRAATATTHLFRSEEFKMKQKTASVHACSPDEVVFGSDSRQSMYCHLLCGLLYSEEVEFVTSTFAYSLVEAFRTFELEWQNMCEDIRRGQLNARITDPTTRHAMANLLRPNPELADIITEKCLGLENWYGLIPEIWPNCQYVYSIMTGSMEPYLNRLQHYAGKLPLVSADYGATEGWIAVNINPKAAPSNVTYTVVPSFGYFEFIPLQLKNTELNQINALVSTAAYEEQDPVGLTEVKVGQEYEVVLTTYGGLYRYRLGDVVRVTGFFNSSPQLAYVCRKNVLLSINIDKNTEKDLQMAVNKAATLLADSGAELIDFTSYADLSTSPGHYVLFWELSNGSDLDERVLESCASMMDRSFVDPGYLGSRMVHTIGPLELCIVKPGTFGLLLDRFLKKGSAITQYKTPRCIGSKELFTILQSGTSRSYFSSAYQ